MKNTFESGDLRTWKLPIKPKTVHFTLANQIAARDALFSHIGLEKQIIALGDLWLLITSGRENPSPFYHTGEKMRLSAKLAGYTGRGKNLHDLLAEIEPELFIISQYRSGANYDKLTSILFERGYICVGQAGGVMSIIHPNDVYALVGSLAMQQKFLPSAQVDSGLGDTVIDLMTLYEMEDLYLREVAPGILLLKDEIISGNSPEWVFYWWVWSEPDRQSDIRLNMSTSEGLIFSQLLNKQRFAPYVLIKQVVSLGDIDDPFNDVEIQILASGTKSKTSACNNPFSVESNILDLNLDYLPPESTGN